MNLPALDKPDSDADLWQLFRGGSVPAFEEIVRRHQSLVCSVAYNACGDLGLSEDVAQETFWAAWRERASLGDPARLRGWLCGIARNLGKNARRRADRVAQAAVSLNVASEPSTDSSNPAAAAVSREEGALIWQTLDQIPESYREPLILFYREEQSVAQVATALDLSEDTVKQRLTRGRGMLRDRMAEIVESGLRRSRPGRAFTVAVVTGLTAASAGAKTAFAGAALAGPANAALGAGLGASLLGGVVGPMVGLLGGWLGAWVPAQLAPSTLEREYLLRTGLRMFLVSLGFCAVLPGQLFLFGKWPVEYYLLFLGGWFLTLWAYVGFESIQAARQVKRIRAQKALLPNDTPLRRQLTTLTARYRGRVYRSNASLFGLPLVDINVSDPGPGQGNASPAVPRRAARGWVAIGDDARGVLLAIGGSACGFIAIGSRAFGVISFGGIAFGVIAVGGVAVGALGIGGVGIGAWACGGIGIGWQACGGAAIAWDMACGGGAAAWHSAFGGAALARDHAMGAQAWADHANDAAAQEFIFTHPLVTGIQWYIAHVAWVVAAAIALFLLTFAAIIPLMYRRQAVTPDLPESLH